MSKDTLINQKPEEKAEKAQQQQQEDSAGRGRWGGGVHTAYVCRGSRCTFMQTHVNSPSERVQTSTILVNTATYLLVLRR